MRAGSNSNSGFTYGVSFASTTSLAATTNEQILAPASNLNGVIVWACSIASAAAAGSQGILGLLAKSSAPASAIDSDVLFTMAPNIQSAAGLTSQGVTLPRPVRIAAGKGLYFRNSAATGEPAGAAYRSIQYTVL